MPAPQRPQESSPRPRGTHPHPTRQIGQLAGRTGSLPALLASVAEDRAGPQLAWRHLESAQRGARGPPCSARRQPSRPPFRASRRVNQSAAPSQRPFQPCPFRGMWTPDCALHHRLMRLEITDDLIEPSSTPTTRRWSRSAPHCCASSPRARTSVRVRWDGGVLRHSDRRPASPRAGQASSATPGSTPPPHESKQRTNARHACSASRSPNATRSSQSSSTALRRSPSSGTCSSRNTNGASARA